MVEGCTLKDEMVQSSSYRWGLLITKIYLKIHIFKLMINLQMNVITDTYWVRVAFQSECHDTLSEHSKFYLSQSPYK